MKLKLAGITAAATIAIFGGCSAKTMNQISENPFGIGYEHSACESAKNGGVCGSPKDIYENKSLIKSTLKDYRESGYKDDLFFAISPEGRMMVKDKRDGLWVRYEGSKFQREIERKKAENDYFQKNGTPPTPKPRSGILSKTQSRPLIPIIRGGHSVSSGDEGDLSIDFKTSRRYIQTNTNVGQMIRDNGKIRKIWIAPVADNKDDLVSAHEIYAVTKDPKWIVGEKNPIATKSEKGSERRSIMSSSVTSPSYGKTYSSEKERELMVREATDTQSLPKLTKEMNSNLQELKEFVDSSKE